MPFTYSLEKRKEMACYYWAHPEMSLGQMAKVFGVSLDTVRRNALQFGKDADKIQIQENKEVLTIGDYKIINGVKYIKLEEFCKRTRSQRFRIVDRFNYKITKVGSTKYIPESFVNRYPSFMAELREELKNGNHNTKLNKENPG